VVENEADDGYPPLQVFVFANSQGDRSFITKVVDRMKSAHDEGHFRFAASCVPLLNEGNTGNDGFDTFFVLDFNDPDQEGARALASEYLGSDIAFGTKRGLYGLKHI
jgi:hypothetical protein